MRTWALTIALLVLAAVPGVAGAKPIVATNKVMVVRWWRGSTPTTTTTTTAGTTKVGAPKVTLPKVPSPALPAPKVPATVKNTQVKPLPKTVTASTTVRKLPSAGQTRLPQPRTYRVVRWTAHGSSIAVLKSALGDPGSRPENEADPGSSARVDSSRDPAVEPLRKRPVPAPARLKGASISRRSTRVVAAAPPSQIKLLDHQMELLQMAEALQ